MKDYIRDGLMRRISPGGILKEINKALEDKSLSKKDRAELMKQKEKIEKVAKVTF